MRLFIGYAICILDTEKQKLKPLVYGEAEDGIYYFNDYACSLYPDKESAQKEIDLFHGPWCSDKMGHYPTEQVFIQALWTED